jgi:20S proteasome alpha/beta subunit
VNYRPPIRPPFPKTTHPIPVKHPRYPKAMTIALGILATDGVVLAADTEVTYEGYAKLNANKVSWHMKRNAANECRHMIVSGAGAETSIEYMRQNLGDWFTAIEEPTVPEIGAELSRQIKQFHVDHVTPHGNGQLDVWMIVAALSGPHQGLWVTDKSICRRESAFGATGSGSPIARSLLERIWRPIPTIAAILLAGYVIWDVKRFVPGCGKDTTIVAASGPNICYIRGSEIESRMEGVYSAYTDLADEILRDVLLASWNKPKQKIPRQIHRLRSAMEMIADEIFVTSDAVSSTMQDPLNLRPTTGDPSPRPPSPERS